VMTVSKLVMMAPLALLLICTALTDLRRRRIPNWLTLAIAAGGFAQSFTALSLTSPLQALAGLGAGLALGLMLYSAGGLGAGDAKLLAAVGTWVGPWGIVLVFAAASIVGLAVVLVQSLHQGTLKALLQNTLMLGLSLFNIRRVGPREVIRTGRQYHSIDKPLPYAVFVLLGTLAVALMPWLNGK
jgi:prepilin peptidase CpaA